MTGEVEGHRSNTAGTSPLERLTVRSEGLTLIGEAAGAPDAPPVLFLHGGGQTRASWKRTLPVVAARGFRAIAYDARGHGDSDWSPDGAYALQDLARDLAAFIALVDRPPVLVGASLGGMTSLALLAQPEPPQVRGLVLVDVTPRANRAGVDRILGFMAGAPNGFGSVEEAAEAVAGYSRHRVRSKSPEGLRRNLRLRDGRYHWHWDPRVIERAEEDRGERDEAMEAGARRVTMPTLLVHAEQSDVVTDAQVDHLRALIPGAEYACVPGTGHMVAGDANDVFNAAILDFLDRIAER